jgi:hypothetical protein
MKPFLMALALMLFQQFSGVNAVLFYLQDIFDAAGSELSTSAFIVCLVQVSSSCLSVSLSLSLGWPA